MTNLKKIITLGPIYPFRGGIAVSSGLLVRKLKEKYDVISVSYTRMYPRFLYPGTDQKDYTNDALKNENTIYALDTINPISYRAVVRIILEEEPDLLIVNWWNSYFAPSLCYILKHIKGRIPICINCNNVLPHDLSFLSPHIAKRVLNYGDMYLIASKEEGKQFDRLLPGKTVKYVSRGANLNVNEAVGITKEIGRDYLGIDNSCRLVLFFGFIRPYKGLQYLLEAMRLLAESDENIKLMIAGEFYENKAPYIRYIEDNGLTDRIIIRDEFVPDDKIEYFFSASDIVVLPYVSGTNSGVVHLAYQFMRPVIVTDVGGIPEIVSEGETGYVVAPMDSEALKDAIKRYYSNDSIPWESNIKKVSGLYTWDHVMTGIEEMWKQMKKETGDK